MFSKMFFISFSSILTPSVILAVRNSHQPTEPKYFSYQVSKAIGWIFGNSSSSEPPPANANRQTSMSAPSTRRGARRL